MKKALVVGIDDYPTAPLFGCLNDASSFGSIIERHGDGSPNFAVKLETNIRTKAQLKSAITDLFQGSCDTALLYFSGHGFLNGLGGYIVTPDYQPNDEGVSMDEILALANQSRANDKIIILDCCHAGAFGSPRSLAGASQITEGVVVLTASSEDESAIEVNGHGVFTNLLLDALRGGAADLRGHITPGSVYAYVDQALGPWDQRPVFKTNVTKFTSLRSINPRVPADVIRKLTTYFPDPQYYFPLDPTYEDTNLGQAVIENVLIFKDLQKYQSVGLVVPHEAEYMYFAAQDSKSCKLTALGYHYWRLVNQGRI